MVNTLPGSEKSIMGHSMGNVVISDAIQRHSLQVNNYFMMDAAVAMESYDSRSITPTSINHMRNPVWQHYIDDSCISKTSPCVDDLDKVNERWLWSTEWHLLFEQNDARRNITWRNIFAGVISKTNVKNYYSSTEEVLAESDGTVSSLDAVSSESEGGIGFKSWTIQEMAKGTDLLVANRFETANQDEVDKYGGWGLNYIDYNEPYAIGFDYSIFTDFINADDLININKKPLRPPSAMALTTDNIRLAPFFKGFSDEHGHNVLYGSKTTLLSADVVDPLLPHLRGHAIPALSDAAGSHSVTGTRNIDMSTELRNDWPKERVADINLNGIKRWKHGDLKDVAYLYVYRLYNDFVIKEAQLNQ